MTLTEALEALSRFTCNDNSCMFAPPNRGGMGTNGGCSCINRNTSHHVHLGIALAAVVKAAREEVRKQAEEKRAAAEGERRADEEQARIRAGIDEERRLDLERLDFLEDAMTGAPSINLDETGICTQCGWSDDRHSRKAEAMNAHADHPNFLCEVRVTLASDEPYDGRHALIYTDGYVAVTLYEYQYDLFVLPSGKCKTDRHLTLTSESIAAIAALGDRSTSIRIRAMRVHAELWRAMNDTPENALAALRDDGYLHAAVRAMFAGDEGAEPIPDAWAAHVAAQDERIVRLEAENAAMRKWIADDCADAGVDVDGHLRWLVTGEGEAWPKREMGEEKKG